MTNRVTLVAAAASTLLALSSAASAGYSILQTTAAAPTYTTTLNFDEAGGPVGLVSPGAWSASHGITEFTSGSGDPFVGNFTASWPWVGPGNSFFGNFGAFMKFSGDITQMSFQLWDPSGPVSPFGGGESIYLFNNGVEVGNGTFTPAWGGVGKSWFNITTTGGSVFDEIRMLGNGFDQGTVLDNMSWNAVPAPGGIALVGAGLFGRSRRRR